MDLAPSQPVQLSRPRDAVQADFVAAGNDRCGDPAWRFRMLVPRDSLAGPDEPAWPTRESPLEPLALFQRPVPEPAAASAGPPSPGADLEVFGHLLPREVDPADWLELWLEDQGMTIVSKRALPAPGGAAGDAVAVWETAEGAFAGRFFAAKWGPRLFVLALRAPRAHYERHAEDFFVSMSSFHPVDAAAGGLLAEEVRPVGEKTPVPWHAMVPMSWIVQPDAADEKLASFQGTQVPLGQATDEVLFGKLALGLAVRSLAKSARVAATAFLDALRDNRVTIASEDFVEEPARAPFVKSWLMVSPAVLDKPPVRDIPCEVRCRVMMSEAHFFVAGVFGPSREVGAIAWAQNKRTLEVVTQTLTLSAPRASGAP